MKQLIRYFEYQTALSVHAGVLATRFAPELWQASPSKIERAQGRPGAGRTHGPPANKNAGGSHHRFSHIIRPSLRDGFTAYT
jgi:hypothetical protein